VKWLELCTKSGGLVQFCYYKIINFIQQGIGYAFLYEIKTFVIDWTKYVNSWGIPVFQTPPTSMYKIFPSVEPGL